MLHRILLVDDDINVSTGIKRTLRNKAIAIVVAENADEAIKVMEQVPIDILITDQRMPGLTGTELLKWACKNSPNTTRILLTGYLDPETAIQATNDGQIFKVFTKPYEALALLEGVRQALIEREQRLGLSDRVKLNQ